ncbi:MAG: shikimate kinase [Archaeoglobales archaeon]|nr:shikimate kinase [Archaeoglobales archaeon]
MIGRAYGAGTILNALATGIGSAFGVNLVTRARVKIGSENILVVNGRERDSGILETILSPFGIRAKISVRSTIPERSGLGSSSAFINSVLCALMKKNGEIFAHRVLKLNAEISLKAKISYTGAFDDASASLLGGIVVSNNYGMKLKNWIPLAERVAILIPEFQRGEVNWNRIKNESDRLKNALKKLEMLKFREVMVENTRYYCEMIGYPLDIAERVWREGICCGLSGNGPAFVAIGNSDEVLTAKEIWEEYGEVFLGKIPEKPAEKVVITSELFEETQNCAD